MITITSTHTQACFDAWINCENLLVSIHKTSASLSKKFSKVIDECAFICMGTFHALKSQSANISRMALLCVGICEECAELCESLDEETFLDCAKICRKCSNSISSLASSQMF
jgi:hypothetical protein